MTLAAYVARKTSRDLMREVPAIVSAALDELDRHDFAAATACLDVAETALAELATRAQEVTMIHTIPRNATVRDRQWGGRYTGTVVGHAPNGDPYVAWHGTSVEDQVAPDHLAVIAPPTPVGTR